MKTITGVTLSVSPAGYGRNKLTVQVGQEKYDLTTSDTILTDRMKSEDDDEAIEAKIEAVERVLSANDYNYKAVRVVHHPHFGSSFEIDTEE